MRIRIALIDGDRRHLYDHSFFISLGSTPGASAPNVVRVSAAHPATTPSTSHLATLALPVLVHTIFGLVIDVGTSHFP